MNAPTHYLEKVSILKHRKGEFEQTDGLAQMKSHSSNSVGEGPTENWGAGWGEDLLRKQDLQQEKMNQ